ncbi:MAG: GTP cyclohydrolase I, partial [Armatimonadota bacterium]|nr:GTP cyclohydrolase I [Armatimonadota bacterium]
MTELTQEEQRRLESLAIRPPREQDDKAEQDSAPEKPSQERVEAMYRDILTFVGEDPDREGLLRTPHRVVEALKFLTRGYEQDVKTLLNGAVFHEEYDDMVVVKDVEFYSMCVPSKQIVNATAGAKAARDVQVGDQLWTLHEGRVVPTNVTDVTSHKTRQLVKVETERGAVFVTPDHPFATPEGWAEAKDLEGKHVEWTRPGSLCRKRYRPQVGYSFGYSLGATFADGTVADRYLSLVVNEECFAQRFATNLCEAFGCRAKLEPVERPSGYTGRQT